MVKTDRKNTLWFWGMLVVALAAGYSGLILVTTHDSACGSPEAPKSVRVFPPGWECETGF